MKNLLKKLDCQHEGAQLVRAYRAMDWDSSRIVYGVFSCPKCGRNYTKEVNRNDPAVAAMLSKGGH